MAQFVTFGRVVLNLDQVCSVSRSQDGSVCVRLSNFLHFEPRPGDAASNRLGATVGGINFGEHVFLGEDGAKVWDYFQNLAQPETAAAPAPTPAHA